MTDDQISLAVIRQQVKTIAKDVTHLHECVEQLKKTVWQATGLVAGIAFVLQLALHIF